MPTRKVIAFFAAILLMFMGLAYVEQASFDNTDKSSRQGNQLYPELNDLVQIKISRPNYGNGVVLKRTEQEWTVAEPIVDSINLSALRLLSQEFEKLVDQPVPANLLDQSDADLGLSPPAYVVETVSASGKSSTLLLGAATLALDFRIASLNGKLCMVPSSFLSLISRPINSWRSNDLVGLRNVNEVSWSSINDEHSFVAQRHAGNWRFVQPFNALLSDLAASSLDLLIGARLSSIGAPLPAPEQFPSKIGDLVLSNSTDEVNLEIYTSAILSDSRAFVLHVTPKSIAILAQDPTTLRSPYILEFEVSHLASLIIQSEGQQYLLVKSENAWRDKNSTKSFAKESISALLQSVQRASFGDISKPRPTHAPNGVVGLSVSRNPVLDKCPQLLWWVDEQGKNWICDSSSETIYLSDINYEIGVKSIVAVKH